MDNQIITPFSFVYDRFLNRITDDMYLELTELDTFKLLEDLLIAAIPWFEFPRVDLYDYESSGDVDVEMYCGIESDMMETEVTIHRGGYFNVELTEEEINILSSYMIVTWIGQQLASIENTRMKYSANDYKFTSQANHLQKLLTLKKDYEREGFHLQRLYKRRKANDKGIMKSTMYTIMDTSPEGREYRKRVYHED